MNIPTSPLYKNSYNPSSSGIWRAVTGRVSHSDVATNSVFLKGEKNTANNNSDPGTVIAHGESTRTNPGALCG